jgi:hypothetical protein
VNVKEILIELDAEIARLQQARHLLTDGKTELVRSAKKSGRRRMSRLGRANIIAAQKKRWAKAKKSTKGRSGHPLSPEAKARISAAQKKRWAAKKAA